MSWRGSRYVGAGTRAGEHVKLPSGRGPRPPPGNPDGAVFARLIGITMLRARCRFRMSRPTWVRPRRPQWNASHPPTRRIAPPSAAYTKLSMSDLDYSSQWEPYRRTRRMGLFLFLGYVPGVVIIGYPLSKLFGSQIPFEVVAICWFTTLGVFAIWHRTFRCPRCHNRFFIKTFYRNDFARKCLHCGLPLWADS
jgi:hypothetical protein